MKNSCFLILLTLLICSCESKPEPKVDVLLNAYETSYDSIKPQFNNFLGKLDKMKSFKNFEMGTINMDSLPPARAKEILMNLKAEEIPIEKRYTNDELIVIYDDFLAVAKNKQKSIDKELFNMGFLPGRDFSFLTTHSSEYSSLINRTIKGEWGFTGKDSITLKEKNNIITKVTRKVSKLDKVKYCLFVDDVIIFNTERKNDKEFYSGTILMQAKIVDIETEDVVARKTFNIVNNETITVGADDPESFINTQMQLDLLYNKVLEMNSFFGFEQ